MRLVGFVGLPADIIGHEDAKIFFKYLIYDHLLYMISVILPNSCENPRMPFECL